MTIADTALNNGDLDKCRYWTDRANKIAPKLGLGQVPTPKSLDMDDILATM